MYNYKKICEPFGSTVAEKALAFSLILGCNPIILHGIDLPEKKIDHNYSKDTYADKIITKVSDEMKLIYRNFYFKNFYFKEYLKEIKNKMANLFSKKTVYGLNKKKTLKNFQILLNIAKKENIKIISLNNKSSLIKLKNIYYVPKNKLDEKYFI